MQNTISCPYLVIFSEKTPVTANSSSAVNTYIVRRAAVCCYRHVFRVFGAAAVWIRRTVRRSDCCRGTICRKGAQPFHFPRAAITPGHGQSAAGSRAQPSHGARVRARQQRKSSPTQAGELQQKGKLKWEITAP